MLDVWNDANLIKTLKDGGIVVMPTDTIYGLVCSALNKDSIVRLYQMRKKPPYKPLIILISDIEDLKKFSIIVSDEQRKVLDTYWPGAVSVIFDYSNDDFNYLTHSTHTITFRLPKALELQNLLKQTGPLVAPSANLSGMSPAKNTEEAKSYFGNTVDVYIDGGEIVGNASKIIKLNQDGSVVVIRD